jgi:hypothetical protein
LVGATVDEVHRDPQLTLAFAAVMNADNVGMSQRGGKVCLTEQPLAKTRVSRDVASQQLQGVAAGQARVLGKVDLPPPPDPSRRTMV